jgi:hypothetical protein
MYLLEDTEEAKEMRQKVLHLIETLEEDNLLLAKQLIEGGGEFVQFKYKVIETVLEKWWDSDNFYRARIMFGDVLLMQDITQGLLPSFEVCIKTWLNDDITAYKVKVDICDLKGFKILHEKRITGEEIRNNAIK